MHPEIKNTLAAWAALPELAKRLSEEHSGSLPFIAVALVVILLVASSIGEILAPIAAIFVLPRLVLWAVAKYVDKEPKGK